MCGCFFEWCTARFYPSLSCWSLISHSECDQTCNTQAVMFKWFMEGMHRMSEHGGLSALIHWPIYDYSRSSRSRRSWRRRWITKYVLGIGRNESWWWRWGMSNRLTEYKLWVQNIGHRTLSTTQWKLFQPTRSDLVAPSSVGRIRREVSPDGQVDLWSFPLLSSLSFSLEVSSINRVLSLSSMGQIRVSLPLELR